jgi:predicted MPP superfamily phosphohydrolase
MILFIGHLFVYETWRYFLLPSAGSTRAITAFTVLVLSVTFVSASLLAARYYNALVRSFYTLASIWLGLLNFLVMAAVLCWLIYAIVVVSKLQVSALVLGSAIFGGAVLISLYGFINASWIRVTRIQIRLPNLPQSWHGRTAALVSDTHLGHVRGYAFVSRIVATLRQLRPDVVFIAGDLFDGTKIEPKHVAVAWRNIDPPLGKFFITGNHEEFSHPSQYIEALQQSGVRALLDEKVIVNGLQLIGVTYHTLATPQRLHSALQRAALQPNSASVLLAHAPHNLAVAEQMGISLQLSGHTHCGQTFPFTWITKRIFRQYTYGLHRHGNLNVYTSSGAGTWGPPMRVGSKPEIVLIRFE